MIQLYKASNTDYGPNGDEILDPIITKAEIEAELNGSWMLEIDAVIDKNGIALNIEENDVIQLPTFMIQGDQRYRIYDVQRSDDSVIAKANPIFYDSKDDVFLIDTRPTNKSGQEALNLMLASNSKYSASSDISTGNTSYYIRKNFIEALNSNDENSFINRWGGEILYNNEQIIVNERVGGDYGVTVAYGKNIKSIRETVNTNDLITRIVPVAYNGYTLDGSTPWVDSNLINSYPVVHYKEVTFGDIKLNENGEKDGYDTLSELRTALASAAQDYYTESDCDKPILTLDIDIVELSQTTDYRDYKDIESIGLGDTVHCYHSKLGITTDARCIKMTYDCVSQATTAVTLGSFQTNYFSNVSGAISAVNNAIRSDGTIMADKIAGIINAVDAQLQLQSTVAKKVDGRAFLIEDLDTSSDLYGAMECGTQGLRIANERTADGKAWDWRTALTAAGLIADVIVSGLLADKTGKSYWNLDTGVMQLTGNFTQRATNGYKSVDVSGNQVSFYDWLDSGNFVGSLGATHNDNNGRKGITLAADQGDVLNIGYYDGTSHMQYLMTIDGSTGKLKFTNTASGTMFQNNSGGGIVVESGLIKSWRLNTRSGDVTAGSNTLHFKDGLLTGVN